MICKIHIRAEEQSKDFVLGAENPKIILGHGSHCAFVLRDPSISDQHLEISLRVLSTGPEIFIRDLGSKGGTHRLPQNAPFLEASFALNLKELKLRLGETEVLLSWTTSAQEIEETRVLGPALAEAPSRESRDSIFKNPFLLLALLPSVGAFLFFVASFLRGRKLFYFVFAAPPAAHQAGAGLDLVSLFFRDLQKSGLIFYGIALLFLALFINRGQRLIASRFPRAKNSSPRIAWAEIFPWLTRLFFSLAIAWPLVLAFFWGTHLEQLPKVWSLLRLSQNPPGGDLSLRARELKELSNHLKGSSLLYVMYFDVQRKRVLAECEGIGDVPWEKKRNCLVLLTAVGVESAEQTQPVLLQELAARASILLSLDGITRALLVEKNPQESLNYFLNALSAMGLNADREEISRLLSAEKNSSGDALPKLTELRRRVEIALFSRQKEMRLPPEYRLVVPGPLESGI